MGRAVNTDTIKHPATDKWMWQIYQTLNTVVDTSVKDFISLEDWGSWLIYLLQVALPQLKFSCYRLLVPLHSSLVSLLYRDTFVVRKEIHYMAWHREAQDIIVTLIRITIIINIIISEDLYIDTGTHALAKTDKKKLLLKLAANLPRLTCLLL